MNILFSNAFCNFYCIYLNLNTFQGYIPFPNFRLNNLKSIKSHFKETQNNKNMDFFGVVLYVLLFSLFISFFALMMENK